MSLGYGDATLFYDNPGARRAEYANRDALKTTIFPGDLYLKAEPMKPFKPAWCDKNDQDMIESYRDDGYEFVTEDRFESSRWRWESGKLCTGSNLVCMWRPYEDAKATEEARQNHLQGVIDGVSADVHNEADKLGISTFEVKRGETVADNKPKKR